MKRTKRDLVTAEVWTGLFEEAISTIPSRFAQLILVARLTISPSVQTCLPIRNLPRVRHVEDLIGATHMKLFRAWLCSPIPERSRDFLGYCNSLGMTEPLARERFLQFCRDIVPYNAATADVKLFVADVELFTTSLPSGNRSLRDADLASD